MAKFLTFRVVGIGYLTGIIVLGLLFLIGLWFIEQADKLMNWWVHK